MIRKVLPCLLALGVCALAAHAQPLWRWVAPSLSGMGLEAVRSLDTTLVLAVGGGGTILRTTDEGYSWVDIQPGVPETLFGLAIHEGSYCLAVGAGGTVLRSTDRGSTWEIRPSSTSGTLRTVVWVDDTTAVAAGEAGTLLRSTDTGLTWLVQGGVTDEEIESLCFMSDSVGIAVGRQGAILRTTDGGVSWGVVEAVEGKALSAVHCSDRQYGFAVGSEVILRTTDGGRTWNSVAESFSGETFTGVFSLDSLTAVVLGAAGTVRRTSDGGLSWDEIEPPVTQTTSDIWFNSAGRGYIAAGLGSILKSSDGGWTWSDIKKETYASGFRRVSFSSDSMGVAVGNRGAAVYTTDAGRSWVARSTGISGDLVCVDFFDSSFGYVGEYIPYEPRLWMTTDGGASWGRCSYYFWYSLVDVAFVYGMRVVVLGFEPTFHDEGYKLRVGQCQTGFENPLPIPTRTVAAISVVDSLNWFAVGGGGQVGRTDNGGGRWFMSTNYFWDHKAVHMINHQTGWVLGPQGQIFRTDTKGETWTQQQSGTTANLSRISFGTADLGVAVGQGGSIVVTWDGGAHWTKQEFPEMYTFTDVHVTKDSIAIVTANRGAILRGFLHADPDAGKDPPDTTDPLPSTIALRQNYPNPFNAGTVIEADLPQPGYVTLRIYNPLGQEVAALVAGEHTAGTLRARWDAEGFPSGVYFYRLTTAGFVQARKMTLVR